jgi:hypothetical protein
MVRVTTYFAVWLVAVGAVLIARFTALSGTPTGTRVPLAVGVMLFTFVMFGSASIYERRRLALRSGLRGSGLFGYLRGWIKSGFVEFSTDGLRIPFQAEREFSRFQRFSETSLALLVLIIPLLLF